MTKTLTKSVKARNSDYYTKSYTYTCVVTENSYSVVDNTTNVTITFSIKGPWKPSFYDWTTYYGIYVDGVQKKTNSSSPYISTSNVQLLTWTGDIAHGDDGSKSINVGVYLYQNNPSGYLPKQYTATSLLSMGDVTLTTIPRVSVPTLSASSVDFGQSIVIYTNKQSSNFTHHLYYYFNDESMVGITNGITDNYTWQIPESLMEKIPSSTSATIKFRLYTFDGSGNNIGSNTVSFTARVPSNILPSVGNLTLTPRKINNQNILVQGKNKLDISVSGCAAGYGSSIASYTFVGPNVSATTTGTSVVANPISQTGSLKYTVTVTDERGRTASKSATIQCYEWSAPSITLGAYRVASSTSTEEDNKGTYLRCDHKNSYSYVGGSNKITVKIYYKKHTDTAYSTVVSMTDVAHISGSKTLSNIATTSSYTVYATITDSYGGSYTSEQITILNEERIVNVRPEGNGIAFGKFAESDGVLDSRWPIKTDGTITATGTINTGDPATTMKNLSYRGNNIISSLSDDTVAKWASVQNLATSYYNKAGLLNGQPSQYGFLVNISGGGTQLHQLWTQQGDGAMFHRSGNSNGIYAWRRILDSTCLYSNSSGTTGTVALSESAANFAYLEIFLYKDASSGWWSVKVPSPNGKVVQVGTQYYAGSSNVGLQLIGKTITISGTTITPGTEFYMNFHSSETKIIALGGQTSIKIMRVDGCK